MKFLHRIARFLGLTEQHVFMEFRSNVEPLVEADEHVLRLLAGARFGSHVTVTLPSGRTMTGDEMRALAAFYAPDAEEPRRPS